MDKVPTGISQTFPFTPGEKDKFLPNRQEVGPIWTTGTWSDAPDFFQKGFLDSQYAVSSEIQCKFSESQPLAKNLRARRFDHSLK